MKQSWRLFFAPNESCWMIEKPTCYSSLKWNFLFSLPSQQFNWISMKFRITNYEKERKKEKYRIENRPEKEDFSHDGFFPRPDEEGLNGWWGRGVETNLSLRCWIKWYGAKAYGEKSSRGCCIFRVSRRVGIRQKGEEVENAGRNKGVSDIVPSDIQGGK